MLSSTAHECHFKHTECRQNFNVHPAVSGPYPQIGYRLLAPRLENKLLLNATTDFSRRQCLPPPRIFSCMSFGGGGNSPYPPSFTEWEIN